MATYCETFEISKTSKRPSVKVDLLDPYLMVHIDREDRIDHEEEDDFFLSEEDDDYEEDSFIYDELNPVTSQLDITFERYIYTNMYPLKPIQFDLSSDEDREEQRDQHERDLKWAKFEDLCDKPSSMVEIGKPPIRKVNKIIKKEFCNSIIRNIPCRHKVCKFAHTFDELEKCPHGDKCKAIERVDRKYFIRGDYRKKCNKVHDDECVESYILRMQIGFSNCTKICLKVSKDTFNKYTHYFLQASSNCGIKELVVDRV
jgi:hypothetical protein